MKKKEQTYEEIVAEIRELQGILKGYQNGDISILGEYSYPAAMKRLLYLRRRQIQRRKK